VRAAGGQVSVIDCRDLFPSLTTLSASDVAFDDTICAMPGVDTVQEALDQLCRSNYDLDSGRLVARIDPIAGKEVGPKDKLGTGTGTGAATDVAFSPDGKLIYVAVPTRNEDNTIFRVGEIGAGTITWRPMVTICGVKLVTLATTAQDPQRVYAIGLRKVTTTENNKSVTQWHGAGLYQINPAQVDPNMSAMAIPGFFPAGHLAITLDGIAVATAVDGDVPVTEYTRLVQVRLPSGSTNGLPPIDLGASGSDDLALTVVDGTVSLAYVVVKAGNGKAVTCREVGNGARVDERPTVVQEGSARCGCSALAGWSP